MKVKNPWVIPGATLLAFTALAWLVNTLVPVAGVARWALWIGMLLLGLLAAVVVHLLVRRKGEPVAPAAL
jgi:hypothetical protein